MPELAFFTVSTALGWAGGRTYSYLHQAKARGEFAGRHWFALAGAMAAAMLFAKFGVGSAARYFSINDFVVGAGGVAMLSVFMLTAIRSHTYRA